MAQEKPLVGTPGERLSRLAHPWATRTLHLGRRSVPAFRFWGLTGIVAALALSLACAWLLSRSVATILILALASVAASLALALARKVLTGSEALVFLHHALAVSGVSAVTLHLLGEPLLPHLEIVVLGLGVVLAFGRLGCLSAGCCHGRPHDWGVIYRDEHVRIGFSESLVGVRLWPLQLAGAFYATAITAAGYAGVLMGAEAGRSLAWCVASYCWGRFGIEFLRGDPVRPYLLGISEAQWTCVLLNLGVLAAGHAGWLPVSPGLQGAVFAFLAIAILSLVRWPGRRRLTAREIHRIAEAVQAKSPPGSRLRPRVLSTNTGIRISASVLTNGSQTLLHYAFSSPGGQPGDGLVATCTKLVLRLDGLPPDTRVLRQHGHGVVHCLIPAPVAREIE